MSNLLYAVIIIASSIFTLTKSECNEALIDGSTYSVLDDENFSASSTDNFQPPSDARLGSGDAWCSMTLVNTDSPWVQVEFDFPVEIHSVAVAGHDRINTLIPLVTDEYIVNYKIQYRPVGGVLQFVIDNSTQLPQVFARNDNDDPETVSLSSPILNTELLRIVALPGSWNTDRACVRFEAYGCPVCHEALIDGSTYSVPDENFSASSTHNDGDHPPSDARLGSGDAWCSMTLDNNDSPWVQVEFDFPVEIHSVAVAGHDRINLLIPLVTDEYIVNYKLQYRPVGGDLQFVMNDSTQLPQVFPRDENDDPQTVSLSSPILNTELLRIVALPGSWNTDGACVRFEAYGCPVCHEALIDGSTYSVPDENFSASSTHNDGDHPPSDARLGSGDAWCSMTLDNNDSPWVQVEFDFPVEIHSVAVAGHDRINLLIPLVTDEYIVNYKLQYRPVGGDLQFVMNDSTQLPQVFPRDENDDPQTVSLSSPILNTELLRIVALPGSWNTDRACVRFEAYGCPATIATSSMTSSSDTISSSNVVTITPTDTISSSDEVMITSMTSSDTISSSDVVTVSSMSTSSSDIISSSNVVKTSSMNSVSSSSISHLTKSSVFSSDTISSSHVKTSSMLSSDVASSSISPSVSTAATSQQTQPVIIGSISGGIGLLVIIILSVMLCVFVLIARRECSKKKLNSEISDRELDIYATIPAQEPNGSIIITNSSVTNGSITNGSVPLDTSSTYDQLDQTKIQWNIDMENMVPNPTYQSSGDTEDRKSIIKDEINDYARNINMVRNPMYQSSGDTEDRKSIINDK